MVQLTPEQVFNELDVPDGFDHLVVVMTPAPGLPLDTKIRLTEAISEAFDDTVGLGDRPISIEFKFFTTFRQLVEETPDIEEIEVES